MSLHKSPWSILHQPGFRWLTVMFQTTIQKSKHKIFLDPKYFSLEKHIEKRVISHQPGVHWPASPDDDSCVAAAAPARWTRFPRRRRGRGRSGSCGNLRRDAAPWAEPWWRPHGWPLKYGDFFRFWMVISKGWMIIFSIFDGILDGYWNFYRL